MKLGTRHRKDSLHKEGRDREESRGFSTQPEAEANQKDQILSALGRATSECWGPVDPWLWKRPKIKEERQNTNCAKGTLTDIGSKWSKKLKRRRKVRESNEKIKDDRSERKIDHGQLSKWKKTSTSALEHLAGKKEK